MLDHSPPPPPPSYQLTWYDGDQMSEKVADLLDDDSTSIANESDDDIPHYDGDDSDDHDELN